MWGMNKSKVRETKTPTKKRNRAMPKGRSSHTHQRKLNIITKFYNRLTKCSEKSKEQYGSLPNDKQTRKKPFFCDKYKTLENFLKVNPIKKPN